MNRFIAMTAALSLSTLLTGPGEARADEHPHRTVFALIVTNNRSVELGRPDLHYADDDGAKYAELFWTIAPQENVQALLELDRDSEALFPRLRGKIRAPTKAAVTAAAAQIARKATAAIAKGDEVDFYFIFAGHGDIDHGKGFLELSDARFGSDDVEAMLRSVPATRAHVILDSCNSFFVLNARKPGGRRAALPEEAAKSLSARLPNVGVFLSTSSEANVFEWSELQSGIFSHAVRSGLLGGADANGDGIVTYDELRAFVQVSTSRVKNPLYRPKVFAHGPHDHGSEPIFPLARAEAKQLEIDSSAEVRLTVRDVNDLPWIDVHKEAGTKLVLRIPKAVAERASLEERETTDGYGRLLRRYALDGSPSDMPARLGEMAALAPPPEARGPNDVLRALFAAPFGPHAMSTYQATAEKIEESVYGVSQEDVERMGHLLSQVADVEYGGRMLAGATFLGMGAYSVGMGLNSGFTDHNKPAAYLLGSLGAVSLGAAAYAFSRPSSGERLYNDFLTGVAAAGPDGAASTLARTELRLFDLAQEYKYQRWLTIGVGATLTATAAALFINNEFERHGSQLSSNRFLFAGVGVCGALSAGLGFIPSPIERLAELWRKDPSLTRIPQVALPQVSLTPVAGGAMLGASGVF